MSLLYITGITGFVGSNLSQYLSESFSIKGVSREKKASLISYNNLNSGSLNDSKALIHLAGKAHDLKNISNEEKYFEANTNLTIRLFDKFLQSKSEVFIFMSSVKAIADTIDEGEFLSENHKPNPITAYGKSKLAAEEYILSKTIPENKRVYILRPCMIHGPNNKGNLNLLYNFVSKGIPYPFGVYNNKRSFLSVKNLCFIIKELLNNSKIPSGVYNLADDESLSTKDLVIAVGQTIHRKVFILNIPKLIINILAKIGDVLPFPINSERVQKLTENYEVSNSKLKYAIQKPLPLTVKQGIELTIKSFNK